MATGQHNQQKESRTKKEKLNHLVKLKNIITASLPNFLTKNKTQTDSHKKRAGHPYALFHKECRNIDKDEN